MINIEEVNHMTYIPEEPEQGAFLRPEEDDTLGPCGCVDYHYSDCPLRTGGSTYRDAGDEQDAWYDDF